VTSLSEIKELRKALIFKGKSQGKFRHLKNKLPKNKHQREKYLNPHNIDESGAILDGDVETLYNLVKERQPQVIVEVGSWFGTSAMVMDKACDGKASIYTCDRHNVYAYDSPNVKYYNMMSTVFFKELKSLNIRADFVFLDARLQGDEALLLKLINRPCTIFVHDYEKGQKGLRNIRALQIVLPEAKLTVCAHSTAMLEVV